MEKRVQPDDGKDDSPQILPENDFTLSITSLAAPSQILTPSPSLGSPSPNEELDVFRWQSPQQRVATKHFSFEDFNGAPKRKRKFKSKVSSGDQSLCNGGGTVVVGGVFCEEERVRRQEELCVLRKMQLDSLR